MDRISTFGQHQFLTRLTVETRAKMDDLQRQLLTEEKSETLSGLGDNAPRLLNLRGQVEKIDAYIDAIPTNDTRMKLMLASMTDIDRLVRDFRNIVNNALSSEAPHLNNIELLSQRARVILDQIENNLNIRDDTRYLFSGGVSHIRPVDLRNGIYTSPPDPNNGVGFSNVVDTGYYQGDSTIQTTQIDFSFQIAYGITADNPAFEKIIRIIDHFAQMTDPAGFNFTPPVAGPPSPSQKDVMQTTSQELTVALEQLSTLASNLSLQHRTVTEKKKELSQFKEYVSNSIDQIQKPNKDEILFSIIAHQRQLEASYHAISHIQKLSLLDYLS